MPTAMDVVFAAEGALFLPGMVEYFSVPWGLSSRKAKEILMEHRFITAAVGPRLQVRQPELSGGQLEVEMLDYAGRVANNYLTALAKGERFL